MGGLVVLLAIGALVVASKGEQEDQMPQDIYCGDMNCYEVLLYFISGQVLSFLGRNLDESLQVLGVDRESPKRDISKAYRKLAGKWHPDMFRWVESYNRRRLRILTFCCVIEPLHFIGLLRRRMLQRKSSCRSNSLCFHFPLQYLTYGCFSFCTFVPQICT